jgi:hypothetical protein
MHFEYMLEAAAFEPDSAAVADEIFLKQQDEIQIGSPKSKKIDA